MTGLDFDRIREALPPLDELRPLLDAALESSDPDPAATWSGSGQLETLGARRVDTNALRRRSDELADEAADRLRGLYRTVAEALSRLADADPSGAAHHFLEAAQAEESRDRPDHAGAYARAAHQLLSRTGDAITLALALRRWARAEWAMGSLDPAGSHYREAHRLARDAGDSRGAAEAAVGCGNVLEEQGRWSEAGDWYRRALTELDVLGEVTPERWHALLNLHIALRSDGRIEESLSWLERAEEAARVLGDESARPFLENARGQLEAGRGEVESAESHLREALAAAGDARAAVTIRLNLAEVLLARGRALDAAEEARRAERDAVRAARTRKLPEVYRLLGRIASKEGNPDAFVFFERSLEIVRERDLPPLEAAITLQAYSEAEAARGEPEAAADLLERARSQFAALGISDLRRPWMDAFDALPEPEPAPSDRAGTSHEPTDTQEESDD